MSDASPTPSQQPIALRRNRAELVVRGRLSELEDVYVQRSSWITDADGQKPFVAVIARNDSARGKARVALADLAGLSDQEWDRQWIPLNLGDFMIRVFPQIA